MVYKVGKASNIYVPEKETIPESNVFELLAIRLIYPRTYLRKVQIGPDCLKQFVKCKQFHSVYWFISKFIYLKT